ncbi:hypothetical protein VTK56DRAFT_5104 [Thermocarpiscus australiensis]
MDSSSNSSNPTKRHKSPSQLAPQTPSPPPTPTTPSVTRTARITATTTEHHHLPTRNSPYLPTPTELALLAAYPSLLLFGTLFSLLSPETRAAPYDALRQAHVQDAALAPSYFARKDNLFNVVFVKRGWAWITAAFFAFAWTHPALKSRNGGASSLARARACLRWGCVTAWWVFVTQWFFGPALIDRGFRFTGGKCEPVLEAVEQGEEAGGMGEVVTAAACKASGGSWRGGHDISGHVFLLVLGSFFLAQEVGWVAVRWARYLREERCIVMHDGAVKGASVESERREAGHGHEDGEGVSVLEALGHGGMFAAVVTGLCGWMLLMTAIYFHTWFEKLTGLLVAFAGLYVIYILPRWVPSLRAIIGLPGI